MSEHIMKTIDELEQKLQDQLNEASETKKTINLLCRQINEAPRYEDVSTEAVRAKGSTLVRPDQFFNQSLSAAVREYLNMRKSAATVDEIYDALKRGGFEFAGKDDSIKKRGLSISLAKNSKLFAYIKASNSFGLWEFYGGRPKDKNEEEAENESDKDKKEKKGTTVES